MRWDRSIGRWRESDGRFAAGLPPFILDRPSPVQIGADTEAVVQEVLAQHPAADAEMLRRMVAEDQMNMRRQMLRMLFTPMEPR